MSVLKKISTNLNRRDEVANQELAEELAAAENRKGIAEIAANLQNKNNRIQRDCIKVLYEIGYTKPELISDYVTDYLSLLTNKHNNLVWGAMIALSCVAYLKPDEIFEQIELVKKTVLTGSVITKDSGMRVLSAVAASNAGYHKNIFPFLMDHLRTCRPKDVPQHAESILPAVRKGDYSKFLSVLENRRSLYTQPQMKRIDQLIKRLANAD